MLILCVANTYPQAPT